MSLDRWAFVCALAGVSIATILAVGLSGAAAAAVQVQNAWSRPAPAGATGVGFMLLTNPGGPADTLVTVTSPVSRAVEIHRSSLTGGMAMMERLARVPAPADATVAFAPGGYHLMFLSLDRALKVGDRFTATLGFANGARLKVRFVVTLSAPSS